MALQHADVVEFQFLEQCWALGWVRSVNPGVRTVAVVHDVISQRLGRRAESATPWLRPILYARVARVRRRERALLNQAHVVTVFSAKDRDLLLDLGVRTPVEIVCPPLSGASPHSTRRADDGRVLFVGAFDRLENADAAIWLLDHVWPIVESKVPRAQLSIVGAHPTEAMSAAASRRQAATVHGFVEVLEEVYEQASVVVVPLHEGAGVKFKTVTAILHGVPVVSTTVGMEGIEAPPGTVRVADTAEQFAWHVIELLAGKGDAAAIRAQAWAAVEYSEQRFLERLEMVWRSRCGDEP